MGVRVGRLYRRQDNFSAVRTEHVIEAAAELRVTVADQKADPSSSLPEHQQQVAGLLGDPGAVGVGGHTARVDPPGLQLDKEQHVQPSQPDGVDGEAGRRLGGAVGAGMGWSR